MEHRILGQSGLQVPVIGMGTWRTFDGRGGAEMKKNARALGGMAFNVDVTFFDCSPMYGAAEQLLGESLQGRRNKALIATKVWASTRSEGESQIRQARSFFEHDI